MHKSRLAALVIDSKVADVNEAAAFWSQALGHACIESKENWALKYVHLKTQDDQPQVLIQKVDHESRVHLDIETDNIEAEVARLEKLGARVVEALARWTVMEAPTGHRFCVVNPQRKDFADAENVNIWE